MTECMRELSLNILDIVQNSIAAGASLTQITVDEDTAKRELTVIIDDNGKGMTREQLQNVQDPFYTTRTTRKVGMGVPLFKMAAEQTGGSFQITSEVGVGTTVRAVFKTDSIDFTPLGDIASTVATVMCMNEDKDFIYTRKVDDESFALSSSEIKAMLDGVPLSEPAVMSWVEGYIAEQTGLLFKERNG